MAASRRFSVAALALGLLLSHCAAYATSPTPSITDEQPVAVACDDSLTVLAGRRITLPFTIVDAAYDSTTQTLYASCETIETAAGSINSLERPTELRKRQLLQYSTGRRELESLLPSEWVPFHCYKGQLLAYRDDEYAVLDPIRGEPLRSFNRNDVLCSADTMFVIRDGKDAVRLDFATNAELWRRELPWMNRASAAWLDSGSLRIIGDGLASLDPRDGTGWEYEISTRRSDLVSRAATNVLTVAMGLTAGALIMPLYWGARLDGLASRPLIQPERITFAADTMVVALRRDSGKPLWVKRLGAESFQEIRERGAAPALRPQGPELPGHLLVRDGGLSLAVVTLGVAPDGDRWWRADPPSIALLDPATGETRARTLVAGASFVSDYQHTPSGHLIMTPQKLLLYDDKLKLLRTIPPPVGTRVFTAFEPDPRRFLLRTNAGLLEMTLDSLTVRWERRLGGGVTAGYGQQPDSNSWWSGRTGLRCIPTDDTRTLLTAALRSARIRIDRGFALGFDGHTVTILALPGARVR